jgi:ATP-dependent DNA helicase RecG
VSQTLADLRMDLTEDFFRKIEAAGRISLSNDPAENLRKIGLLKDDQVTFAALLLFGEHHTAIHVVRYKTKDEILEELMIRSPLMLAVDEAITFIKKCIAGPDEFAGELRQRTIWPYPLPVLRELLLNAIIHKDYRNPKEITVKIFDDRIRFANPGTPMGNLTPRMLLKGEYAAMHRNKLLAEAFYLLGEVEKSGKGFLQIRDALKDSPEIMLSMEARYGATFVGLTISENEK